MIPPMLFWEFLTRLVFSRRANSLMRRISLITILGVTLSLMSFLLVLFVMNSMNDKTKRRVIALEPHLVIERTDGVSIEKEDPIWEELKGVPREGVFPFESQDVILRSFDGKVRGALARGVDEASFFHLYRNLQKLQKKEQLGFIEDLNLAPRHIVLGVDLARSLDLYEGSEVMLLAPEALLLPPSESPPYRQLRMQSALATDLSDFDSKVVLYRRGTLNMDQKIGHSVKSGLEVYLENPDQADELKERILLDGYHIETWQERNSDLFRALLMEKIIIGMILTLAALVGGSAMVTVMSLLISQKRRDIAILRTLGLSQSRTEATFVRLGMVLSMMGVVFGVCLGLAFGYYLEYYPLNVLPTEVYYDSQIQASVDLRLVGLVLVAAVFLSYFGVRVSTKMIADIEPITALRIKT